MACSSNCEPKQVLPSLNWLVRCLITVTGKVAEKGEETGCVGEREGRSLGQQWERLPQGVRKLRKDLLRVGQGGACFLGKEMEGSDCGGAPLPHTQGFAPINKPAHVCAHTHTGGVPLPHTQGFAAINKPAHVCSHTRMRTHTHTLMGVHSQEALKAFSGLSHLLKDLQTVEGAWAMEKTQAAIFPLLRWKMHIVTVSNWTGIIGQIINNNPSCSLSSKCLA